MFFWASTAQKAKKYSLLWCSLKWSVELCWLIDSQFQVILRRKRYTRCKHSHETFNISHIVPVASTEYQLNSLVWNQRLHKLLLHSGHTSCKRRTVVTPAEKLFFIEWYNSKRSRCFFLKSRTIKPDSYYTVFLRDQSEQLLHHHGFGSDCVIWTGIRQNLDD